MTLCMEFRTPLTVIREYTELLLTKCPMPLNFNALLAQLERFITLRREQVEENNPSVEREVSLAGAGI